MSGACLPLTGHVQRIRRCSKASTQTLKLFSAASGFVRLRRLVARLWPWVSCAICPCFVEANATPVTVQVNHAAMWRGHFESGL